MHRRDAADPLRPFRARFALPDGIRYFDGNSLGALPVDTAAGIARTVTEEWGQGLVRSWNDADWIGAPQRVGAKIARLIGAQTHEVLVADSTSANLYKLLVAAVRARPGRRVILTEPGNFPTDLYIAQGVADLLPGIEVRSVPRERIADAIDATTAVLMLTHVHYKSGARFDMAALTRRAHDHGALALWDLSHSTGAVALDLRADQVDLAVGCGYKYLNGGPGAPAFLYVAEHLQATLSSPLTGWMGHAAGFRFEDDYAPAPGVSRFLCGTPPILGLSALETGVDLMLEADRAALFAKSEALTTLFIALVEQRCAGHGLALATPRDPAARGSHVSLRHAEAHAIMQALIARGVIGDFRAPDILRFGFTPLYVGYADVWHGVDILRDVLQTGEWRQARFQQRAAVT
ncbi:kynureninase [Sphingomonas abietis]|uniref:Kynureninase n=1 Tax=Sphingomonas abietis TaxID=3012344 RepID=A0ABY7NSW2_9SPHN|nr:kynureninase [Sphingomonas abietis]WBO24634.1 kynureninase [Sphingomonas abietis]